METERFQPFTYDELVARDKANLDIIWLRDESPRRHRQPPAPEVIAAEIVEDLQAALEEFTGLAASLPAGENGSALGRNTGEGNEAT